MLQEVIGTIVRNDLSLMSTGLDSIGSTELVRKLGEYLETSLASTLLFDHPSVSAITHVLAKHLVDEHIGDEVLKMEVPGQEKSVATSRAKPVVDVSTVVGSVLRELGTAIQAETPLMTGLDSITAMELTRGLQERLRIRLPSTLLFSHPTTSSLV